MKAEQQAIVQVHYAGVTVGDYRADIIVEQQVLLEPKSAREIDPVHQAQLLNYLRATGLRRGLILNFGTARIGIKRIAL